VQLGFGRFIEAPGSDPSRVVHKDVEPAERRDSLLDGFSAAFGSLNVSCDAPDGRARPSQLIDRFREGVGSPARNHDFRALAQ
jgi:hypothetical protein